MTTDFPFYSTFIYWKQSSNIADRVVCECFVRVKRVSRET